MSCFQIISFLSLLIYLERTKMFVGALSHPGDLTLFLPAGRPTAETLSPSPPAASRPEASLLTPSAALLRSLASPPAAGGEHLRPEGPTAAV